MKRTIAQAFARSAKWIVLLFAVAAPLVFWGAARTIRSNSNKVADWLPPTYAETGDLRWFREHFVADQFVIISWEGCRLGDDPALPDSQGDDPRIERLAVRLEANAAGEASYVKSVTTGRRLLNRLTSPPMSVSYETAVARLQGGVIGEDGRQTCVIVTLADDAIQNLREVLGRKAEGRLRLQRTEGTLLVAMRECGIDPGAAHFGGPPIDNIAIDEEGERTMIRLAGLAALFGLGLAWFSLRSVRLTAIVFACGILSAAGSLAAVSWTGSTSDAILLSMPSLVYVLAISGAVHLINYYHAAIDEEGIATAALGAIARGWKPALLCSVTTALGLLSLYASDLTPIRKFGVYSAVGVMQMLIVLFLFLPAALHVWPSRNRRKRDAASLDHHEPVGLNRFWHAFGSFMIRRHGWVTAGSVALILFLCLGLSRTQTNVDLMKLFGSRARILQDYRWLETHIGRLVPMEIVVRFDHSALAEEGVQFFGCPQISLLDRMRIIQQVQQTIERRFGESGADIVGPSIAATTFVPPLPSERKGTFALVRRTATNSQFEQSYPQLLESGYLATDRSTGDELWRISVRVAAFEDVDYGRFAGELRDVVDPVIMEHSNKIAYSAQVEPQIDSVYTGVIPIVYKTQRALLQSLVESTCWSFLTITPLLMFVSRGVRAGIVTMLPNVLPILIVFGGMGWLSLPIDIGSMMSASIALGVAVDDTIHYLTWFRESLDRTGDRNVAILAAYEHCATPTLQAALINGLGLSVFAFSTFTPTRQFGTLMLTILLAGVVAELILLPALLAGPLGSVFQPRPKVESPRRSKPHRKPTRRRQNSAR
ncbi:MMPL family transporter [Blastopirellula sp. JC732]|uniref:MMPL family transporter n=1 Tax=Blastopirellula sediminis TaxID=2894196 RepID=A0A9X1SLR2_9BACT|nr:MMPL family transporter [Blastopirellula sediminis]MCC9605756.1 MMPL family transporter [Blastopirellula sediminis]MCC9630944.1 MMPL family transporter [Blastopirellula sediminis]